MKLILTLLLILISIVFTKAQPFQKNESVSSVLSNVSNGCAKWVDYDLDGDFDILVTGESDSGAVTQLFEQEYGYFTPVSTVLPPLIYSDVSFADIDNDNYPDLFISGAVEQAGETVPASFLFRNNNGIFEELAVSFTAVSNGSSCWGDLDNDGDYDLVLVGNTGESGITKLFRNDGDYEFTEINNDFVGIFDGEVDLGDYDNDLDIDIVVCGFFKNAQGDSLRTLKIYRNDGDFSFTAISGPLVGMGQCNVSWWDYDSDGDLDIIANGSTDAPTYLVYIYQNLGNDVFSNIGIEIFGTVDGSVSVGDYDNDGDEDFLLTGHTSFSDEPVSVVYRNVATNLFNKDYSAVFTPVEKSSTQWCDYNGNGNLDVVISGFNSLTNDAVTAIYDNKNLLTNSPPSIPQNPDAQVDGNNVILSWDASTDVETPSAGLTYNLRIGTTPGGSEIMSPVTDSDDKLCIVSEGNVFHNTSWKLDKLAPGIYYFNVQSVDNGFESSAFSEEDTFVVIAAGVLQKELEERLTVFPNPAFSHIFISVSFSESTDCSFNIFDVSGGKVKQLNSKVLNDGKYSAIWDLKDKSGNRVSNGVYLVQTYLMGKSITSYFVIQ